MKSSLQPQLRRFIAKLSRPGCCFNSDPPGGCSVDATAKLLRDEAESIVPNIDPEQVRKLAGWGLTQRDIASSSAGVSPSSAWVFNQFRPLRRLVIKNRVEQGHGTQSNRFGIKDSWPSASRNSKIKPGSETVNNPDPDSFRPQNQRSRHQNPKQTRPQPPVERGWADKADSRPPGGPVAGGAIGTSGMP